MHETPLSPCALAGFLYSVSELDTSRAPVVIVFTVTPAFLSPAFLRFKNLKHTSVASSWRNRDDLRT